MTTLRLLPFALVLIALAGCSSAPSAVDAASTHVDASAPAVDSGPIVTPDSGPATSCTGFLSATGQATYYDADGSGACGFPAQTSGELLVAAMNAPMFDTANVCGMCAHISGPTGEVTVQVVDLCPECPTGNLNLSPDAFMHISPLSAGRVPITWEEVPCDVSGPLVYHFKDGSNQWWTALQIRNHRHRIATVEAMASGAWTSIERLDYNYFVDASGLGPGPYALRVTDIHGHVVEDDMIPGGLDNADASSAGQLAACE